MFWGILRELVRKDFLFSAGLLFLVFLVKIVGKQKCSFVILLIYQLILLIVFEKLAVENSQSSIYVCAHIVKKKTAFKHAIPLALMKIKNSILSSLSAFQPISKLSYFVK